MAISCHSFREKAIKYPLISKKLRLNGRLNATQRLVGYPKEGAQCALFAGYSAYSAL
jgi:hypothetical protein